MTKFILKYSSPDGSVKPEGCQFEFRFHTDFWDLNSFACFFNIRNKYTLMIL